MKEIYQVTIHGRKMESCDLRQLLARAVREKKSLDRRLRISSSVVSPTAQGWNYSGPGPTALALSGMP